MRAWFSAVLISVLTAGLVLFGVWGTMRAYESHQSRANEQAALQHARTAEKAYNGGNYELAKREFLRAAEISPGSSVGRISRRNAVNSTLMEASARLRHGNRAGAEEAYLEALRIDPSSAAAYAELAVLLYNRGRRTESFTYWDRALSLWHEQLRGGNLETEEVRTAREGLAHAEQNYARALLQEGDHLARLRRNHEAIQIWQRVLQVAPGSRTALVAQQRLNEVSSIGLGIFPSYMRTFP
jgi:tetratricopeptide (TPR) repeat protein